MLPSNDVQEKCCPCNRGKYTKASSDVLEVFSFELRYISPDDKELVCKTCDRTLVRGSMPVQAKANGLKLCEIPSELSRLNVLELRLLTLGAHEGYGSCPVCVCLSATLIWGPGLVEV